MIIKKIIKIVNKELDFDEQEDFSDENVKDEGEPCRTFRSKK